MMDNHLESVPTEALVREFMRRQRLAIVSFVGDDVRAVSVQIGGSSYDPMVALGVLEIAKAQVHDGIKAEAKKCTCGKCNP